MPAKTKRLNRVRCSCCKKIVGHDSSIKRIDKCSRCHSSKKYNPLPKTAAGSFARTKKGPAPDLPGVLGDIPMRSSWERNFARVLTIQNIKWTYERVAFTFSANPKTKKAYTRRPFVYIPDFYEVEADIIWEIKGYLRSEDRSKMRRLKSNYPEEFKKMKACLSKSNKKGIAFYQGMGIPCIFIEDLRDKWRDKIPAWE